LYRAAAASGDIEARHAVTVKVLMKDHLARGLALSAVEGRHYASDHSLFHVGAGLTVTKFSNRNVEEGATGFMRPCDLGPLSQRRLAMRRICFGKQPSFQDCFSVNSPLNEDAKKKKHFNCSTGNYWCGICP